METEAHVYFQQLRLDWQCRFEQAANTKDDPLISLPPRKDLTHIPSSANQIRKQLQRLFQ